MNFYATLEYTNPGEAIVALFDEAGEWCCAGRVECRSRRRDDLYEEGYRLASFTARSKGGRLERYRVVDP